MLPEGNFKVNFDASWDKACNEVGIGAVVRDHRGVFYASISKPEGRAMLGETSELLAIRESIIFAWEFGFRDLIL